MLVKVAEVLVAVVPLFKELSERRESYVGDFCRHEGSRVSSMCTEF